MNYLNTLIQKSQLTTKQMTFQLKSKNGTTIKLIDGEQAVKEFSKIDRFISNMSKFDLQSRLDCIDDATIEKYIDFITKQILPWESKYAEAIENIVKLMNEKANDVLSHCNFPSEIFVILTNGKDEASAAYCRNLNLIILPTNKFNSKVRKVVQSLEKLNLDETKELANGEDWFTTFPHELFHILSRNNIPLRDKLYESIGYFSTAIVGLPEESKDLKITNPDAPVTEHYIKLTCKQSPDKELCLAPVLIASKPYTTEQKDFFSYLTTRFVAIDEKTRMIDSTYEPISYSDVNGFYEKIGRNTKYIIHPEEILADNFVLVLQNNLQVPSPNIVKTMRDIIVN